jgi:hypothetical protein
MEVTKLYGGKIDLLFDDKRHIYYVNGKVIDGVTTVIGVIDKSGPLMYWCANLTKEYLSEKLKPGISFDEIEIKDMLDSASRQYLIKRDKAADIGTCVHKFCEDYINFKLGKSEQPEEPINPLIKNGANSFLKWVTDNNVEFVFTERKIYSQKYGYAGTLDILGKVNGNLAIIDIKTSKGIYSSYHLQVAAYREALIEELDLDIKESWILKLGKEDGSFEAKRIDSNGDNHKKDFEGFFGALKVYRRIKELNYQKRLERTEKI